MRTRVRLKPSDIEIVGRLRPDVDAATVDALVVSIEKIGLQNPISVYFVDDFIIDGEPVDHVPILAAGMHRLEAVKRLGFTLIECDVFDNQREARMWEISENLHRNDLTQLQRDDHIAMWIRLVDEEGDHKPAQSAQVSKGGRGNKGGISEAAREFGIDRDDARRAIKVSALSDEAKEVAREVGLDDNRTVLLQAAKAEPSKQAEVIRQIAEYKSSGIDAELKKEAARNMASWLAEHSDASQWEWIKSTLYTAGAKAIADAFVNETGAGVPVMDRRFG